MEKRKKSEERSDALVPVNAGSQREAAQAEIKALQKSITFPSIVASDADNQSVADTLRKVATAKKNIEAKRRSVTRLLDAAKKGIMEWFAPMVAQCDNWRKEGDALMFDWRHELARRAEEARRVEEKREEKRLAALRRNEEKKLEEARSREAKNAVREAYREKRHEVQAEQQARREGIVTERPKAAGISIKKTWKFELEDSVHAVPEEYWIVALNKDRVMEEIKAQVAAGRSEPKIRGLRIWQDEGSAVGGL